MDTAKVKTPDDFIGPPSSPKRKRHTSIACECCRKLKVRCIGGESAIGSAPSAPKPCNHCISQSKNCVWPEEDGRKKPKITSPAASDLSFRHGIRGKDVPTVPPHTSIPRTGRLDSGQPQGYKASSDHGVSPTFNPPTLTTSANGNHSSGEHSNSSASQTSYTTVHYYRHLGPTGIAPGHKKVVLKAQQDNSSVPQNLLTSLPSHPKSRGLRPLFDANTGLPVQALLPQLLDAFFRYYGDNFCHLNRRHVESLIEDRKASIFLICVMAALSSRFCPPELFADFSPPREDGSQRESWEFSKSFLDQAKALTMSAVDLPSPAVVGGLIMLAFVDFGDNNEAGLWTFTRMALQMVIELGLHRERSCLDTNGSRKEPQPKQAKQEDFQHSSKKVSLNDYNQSSETLLFWIVYTLDVSLCNGTGRVPGLKRHEINVRLPTDADLAVVRAGPGGHMEPTQPEVYPQTARMMLSYAQAIDFLNTGSRQIRFQSDLDSDRMDRIEELKANDIQEYRLVPKEIGFGANQYQAAVKAGQAGPYLLLHLQYHLQIAFLTQESLAGEEESLVRPPDRSVTNEVPIDRRPNLDIQKVNQELYQASIKSITDMLTFAKLIDERALLTTIFSNQAFFHAACAYSRDMLQSSGQPLPARELSLTAFPIPSQTSPSMVFQFDDYSEYPRNLVPRGGSRNATESTYSFLSLIAKANYQFLRQAIKDQTQIYAGSGWVDACLDQREKGLRDVDLSIVSESISTFIRLHDLREPGGSETALQKFAPLPISHNEGVDANLEESISQLPHDFLADTELNFDPQAFFDDYMFSELANQNGYDPGTTNYGNG